MGLEDEWVVNLPRTAALWRAGSMDEIEEMLSLELDGQASDILGSSCGDSGGWPEDEQVEVLEVKHREGVMKVKVRVDFVEVVPSGCKDMPHRDSRHADFELTMHRDDDWATVDYSVTSPDQWELWERNSAADGT